MNTALIVALAVLVVTALAVQLVVLRRRGGLERGLRAARISRAPEQLDAGPSGPPPRPPEALVQAVASGDCQLFAGPGLSALAGLPDRRELLSTLIEDARSRERLNADDASSLQRSLESGSEEAVADELAELLPRPLQRELIEGQLKGKRPVAAHRILASMPFQGVVSMSYDDLLAQAFDRPLRPLSDELASTTAPGRLISLLVTPTVTSF